MRPQRYRILKLLRQILINRLATLQYRPSILKALNLLQNQTGRINLILPRAVYRNDALSGVSFGLLLGKDFYLGAAGAFDDVSDHVAL